MNKWSVRSGKVPFRTISPLFQKAKKRLKKKDSNYTKKNYGRARSLELD